MTSSVQGVDVLILGAGPAGSGLALGLLAAGVRDVLVADKPIARPFAVGESATPDVPGLLAELGLENDLGRLGHRPYHGNLSLWGAGPPIVDHFLQRGYGHGWHLDRAAFDAWLLAQAVARGAQLARPATLDAVAPATDGWLATLAGFGQVSVRVVVDATGRRAALSTRLGARQRRLDSLVALAAQAVPAERLAGLSLLEPFADGWWYAAPLPDGRAVITLMTDRDIALSCDLHRPEAYFHAWQSTQALASYVPPVEPPAVAVFPAHTAFLDRAAGSHWLALGDALLAFDPLTSSGIPGALSDAVAAVPVVQAQLRGECEPARSYARRADSTLRRYLAERRERYAAEPRWRDRPFWSRRIGSGSPKPTSQHAFR